jgi:uncharacterized protein (TIGR02118 family)
MIKRFVVLRRKPTMSVAEFRHYWEKVHGPLIAKIPGIRKYTQYHVRSELLDNTDAPIDGIAELWFDSEDAQKAAYATPEYAVVVADESNLFEMNSRFVHPVMTERTVEII